MSILIVDDSKSNRAQLTVLLHGEGFTEVLAAGSAGEAFQILGLEDGEEEHGQVDLILMDITMPGMDGTEACQRIKTAPKTKDIPIIMVTAHDDAQYFAAAFAAGAMDYLTKPIDRVQLHARVNSALTIRSEVENRRKAYLQLEEQFFHAQKLQCVGRVASGIAHDFNNLLTGIIGYTQLGIMKLPPGDSLRDDLEQINRAGEMAAGLNQKLMAFARPGIIGVDIVDLTKTLSDLDKMLRVIASDSVEIKTDLESELWPVRLDRGQFEQVLVNLVVNARDAIDGIGEITIGTANTVLGGNNADPAFPLPSGDYVRVSVSDNGSGMTEEVKAHLFEPFFTTKEPGKGTGLGLATCYDIIQQCGGHIEVSSVMGRGTCFDIFLPRGVADITPLRSEHREDLTTGTETVLIAEDESMVRELMARALRDRGYSVIEASDGIEALEKANESGEAEIRLLLSDVEMPRMGGIELAARFRAINPSSQVLLVSGLSEDSIEIKGCLNVNPSFLPKPFQPEGLLRKVRETLDSPTVLIGFDPQALEKTDSTGRQGINGQTI